MKRLLSTILAVSILASMGVSMPVMAENADIEVISVENVETDKLDTLLFGNSESEAAHLLTEYKTKSGVDNEASAQSKDENGKYTGGGLGNGLSYRYIEAPAADNKKDTGYLRFTLKADTAEVNYITVRLSGNQFDRGNLMLYAGGGSTDVLDPLSGREYAELDCGQYNSNPPFPGRYYYATYKIPQQLVKADGTVDLMIVPTGKMDSYGSSKYSDVKQSSKYIYSISVSTDPYYVPEDNLIGTGAPEVVPVEKKEVSAYEFLQGEVEAMTERVMSWQCYGEAWEAKKTADNAFMDGAIIRNTTIADADMSGTGDEVARRYTQNAILHQNWSTMSNLMVLSNAFCFEFSKYKDNPEILDRYFRLLDFYEKAQDSEGGWCYHTAGEDKYAWLGADLNGSGERGKGEWWPLMSLGADAMMQSYVQLHDYIIGGDNEELKSLYNNYLEEKIDGDLTGNKDKTRREFYIEMFAKLRDRLANPQRGEGDFYAPTNRAGTANQDFGFAYYANNIVECLEDTATEALNTEYASKNSTQYLDMVKYKYGEMVDGEKWFSDLNGTGLEGGASHGGWAGDYATLLINIAERYAESARYLPEEAQQIFNSQAYNAYESAKYYFYPAVDVNGNNVLSGETYASSRKDGYSVFPAYPIAGYTATYLNSDGALTFMAKYIEDDRGYTGDIRSQFDKKGPHIYTSLVDSQNILKYYKEVEELIAQGKIKPLPMEDEHKDFAWFDPDAQSVVFKNGDDRCYVTFNFRRGSWEYNDYTRIHLINEDIDRLADVRSSHQGGLYTWQDDTHKSDAGNPYTHTRYDGMNEVKYGKYIIALNMSKNDSSAGQSGKTYTMSQTTGVVKARDLVSGKVYESAEGISVDVAPQSCAVLEVLETIPTETIGVVYKCGDKILGSDTVEVVIGTSVDAKSEAFDGYSLADGENDKKTIIATATTDNKVVFEYKENSLPEFTAPRREVVDKEWTLFNPVGVEGGFDDNKIWSIGIDGETNLKKTFMYKEAVGDFKIHVRLKGFDRTVSDKDYFSILMTDALNFEKANYVEYRHFTNNNNILVVEHISTQEKSTTSHWAGDMNNKAVPIDVIFERKGNKIEYWFSLDGGKTYEQTSKPSFEFEAADAVYIGLAMTAGTEEKNTAYFEELSVDTQFVGEDINIGDTVTLDFSSKDADGDNTSFEISQLPEGAVVENQIVTFTPVRGGEYIFTAKVNDGYHSKPAVRTHKINVAPVIKIKVNGEYLASDVSPYITDNSRTMVPVRVISEALGAEVNVNEDNTIITISKDNNTIVLKIGEKTAEVNGVVTELDEAAVITDSRTMVPIRFVSEQLRAIVGWEQSEYTVTIDINI